MDCCLLASKAWPFRRPGRGYAEPGGGFSQPFPRGAVAAVVCRTDSVDRRYLLVQRSMPPAAGQWSLPGGKLELSEGILAGAAREVEEECGLTAASLRWHPWPITATDAIFFAGGGGDRVGSPEFHYLVAQCFAWHDPAAEVATPGDDALDARWLSLKDIRCQSKDEGLRFTGMVVDVVRVAEDMIIRGLMICDPSAAAHDFPLQ
mmetsp:Transcript_78366/g.221628  ORF Transcript_78366/g.221628 Transcript_78366/m.221628 type:complete len:205 (-) Transcript_78366:32-646(-)